MISPSLFTDPSSVNIIVLKKTQNIIKLSNKLEVTIILTALYPNFNNPTNPTKWILIATSSLKVLSSS